MKPFLIVISGPTAVGKTSLSIALAKYYETVVISADSRQFFRELNIGTASPTKEEMDGVKHFFIANKSVSENYDVAQYEGEAIACLEELFKQHKIVILSGGSGLYIDSVCKGLDKGLPKSDPEIRNELNELFEEEGITALQEMLKILDKKYYAEADIQNHRRLIRALEVRIQTGKPYSSFRKGKDKERFFNTVKIALDLPRDILYERINKRVEKMMEEGLESEARSVYEYRNNRALQTVGYKELFAFFEGNISREEAIAEIKKNSRRYAKRQLTWLKRDKNYLIFAPNKLKKIIALVDEKMKE